MDVFHSYCNKAGLNFIIGYYTEQQKTELFAVEGEVAMIMLGNIGESDCHEFWFEIPKHFQNVRLDVFVVMPNHIHGILLIGDSEGGNKNMDAKSPTTSGAYETSSKVGNENADAERGGETP
ncbi:MAG: hypothetical protein HW390_3195 [Candidatus Brocadiaceae bacterium]|nr:hypothetical protein [Candidatus Brocadiaceae bacterium]